MEEACGIDMVRGELATVNVEKEFCGSVVDLGHNNKVLW
jgi:hypothetical protein